MMKKTIQCLAFLLFISFLTYGQKSQKDKALHYIKVGNTLREARQFNQSEQYLREALRLVEGKNKYWEASAQEGLGLLYREMHNAPLASRHFVKALDLYKELKKDLSAKAILVLLEGVEGKEQIYAGIEIGAKGVKLSVVGIKLNLDSQYEFRVIYGSSENPDVVSMTDKAIGKTVKSVKKFLKLIAEKYKLPANKIFIVGSSGVYAAAQKKLKFDKVKKALKDGLPDSTNTISFINAKQEAKYVIEGSTLHKFRARSSTIDIGSGNTKGGFLKGSKTDIIEAIDFPYGTETLVQSIQNKKVELNINYDSAAKVISEELLEPSFKEKFDKKEGLRTRSIVHLVGGAPWVMVTYMYPEYADKMFVRVAPSKIRQFLKLAADDYEKLIAPDLTDIADDEIKLAATENINRAKNDFNRAAVIAGGTILNAIVNESNKTKPIKKFYFARQGYIGWITGFILETVEKEYEALDEWN